MEFKRRLVETCSDATGMVVVIDVLRAFTTTAYAFAAGATKIVLVGTVEEAFALREQIPGALLSGEVGGLPIKRFDLPNSPTVIAEMDLKGRTLVERTTAGTQGIVRSERAEVLLAASFCNARATARYVQARSPEAVTFVITGVFEDNNGDEDAACADYMEALLTGEAPDPVSYLERVRESKAALKFRDPAQPDFPVSDLEYAMQADKFDFAMVVRREEGRLVMRAMGEQVR